MGIQPPKKEPTQLEGRRLKVIYDSLDLELDRALELLMRRFGYRLTGRGFDLLTRKRNLGFVKENERNS